MPCVEKDSEAASVSAVIGVGGISWLSGHLLARAGLGALQSSFRPWSPVVPHSPSFYSYPVPFHHLVLLLLELCSSVGRAPGCKLPLTHSLI